MSQPLMTDFDARAETWDDANKVKRAEDVAAAMRRAVPLSRSMKALEYGAGTGLLSFCLRDALGPITLADSSAGMRAVAERKIAAANAGDMRVIDLDLMRDPRAGRALRPDLQHDDAASRTGRAPPARRVSLAAQRGRVALPRGPRRRRRLVSRPGGRRAPRLRACNATFLARCGGLCRRFRRRLQRHRAWRAQLLGLSRRLSKTLGPRYFAAARWNAGRARRRSR